MNRKKLLEIISREIVNWDPISLLAMGAPKNEYDVEVNKILGRLQNKKNSHEISNVIYEVFLEMFGEDTLRPINDFTEKCDNVAKVIFLAMGSNSRGQVP
ncbi:MAG: DUF1871 family protein [Oscillospiraceae bacterium]|nr:DUF1871 family protein [Oscillospiraceae bacterium]